LCKERYLFDEYPPHFCIMADAKITIEAIQVADLPNFEASLRCTKSSSLVTPLTPARAKAQASNPNAASNDVGLLVAFSGPTCVGHISILPGILRVGASQTKMLWSHAFFVHPNFRTGPAAFLLIKRIAKLGSDVFVTGFNEPSRAICSAFGFQDFGPLDYLRIDLGGLDVPAAVSRRLRHVMGRPARATKPSAYYPWLRNFFFQRCQNRLAKHNRGCRWKAVERLRRIDFPEEASPLFERDIATINWMLEYPWLREKGELCHPPYYFSDRRSLYQHLAIEIEGSAEHPIGFAVFLATEKGGKRILKTLDHLAFSNEQKLAVLEAAFQYGAEYQVDQMILPIELKTLLDENALTARVTVTKQRNYQWLPSSNKSGLPGLTKPVSTIRLNYADGDCAFG